jgi:hypothetical protein
MDTYLRARSRACVRSPSVVPWIRAGKAERLAICVETSRAAERRSGLALAEPSPVAGVAKPGTNDALSGALAGVGSRFLTHPFDTVKVRAQCAGALKVCRM